MLSATEFVEGFTEEVALQLINKYFFKGFRKDHRSANSNQEFWYIIAHAQNLLRIGCILRKCKFDQYIPQNSINWLVQSAFERKTFIALCLSFCLLVIQAITKRNLSTRPASPNEKMKVFFQFFFKWKPPQWRVQKNAPKSYESSSTKKLWFHF